MQGRVKIFIPFLSRSHNHYYLREIREEADVSHLVSRLRVKVNDEHRRLRQPEGPEGRLKMLRHTVTALFKYERIEATYNRTHEAQGYAERLIAEAIKHGDCHVATMEIADYWLLEKQLIHKLFKVLVPRFESSTRSYTRFYTAPRPYYGDGFYKPKENMHIDEEFAWKVHRPRAVLELRGNPYPPLLIPQVSNSRSLHNVLLWAAREEKRKLQVEETLREEGLLVKTTHVKSILAKSSARLQERDILGDEQNQLSESVEIQTNAKITTCSSGISDHNLNEKPVEESNQKDNESDCKTKQPSKPTTS